MAVRSRVATVVSAVALAVVLSACVPSAPVVAPTGSRRVPSRPRATRSPCSSSRRSSRRPMRPRRRSSTWARHRHPAPTCSPSSSTGSPPAERPRNAATSSRARIWCRRRTLPTSLGRTIRRGLSERSPRTEDLFGLVQVYGRIFDDAATASGFLDAFVQTVAGCAGYQLAAEDGTVTYQAIGLHLEESATAPVGTRVVLSARTWRGPTSSASARRSSSARTP